MKIAELSSREGKKGGRKERKRTQVEHAAGPGSSSALGQEKGKRRETANSFCFCAKGEEKKGLTVSPSRKTAWFRIRRRKKKREKEVVARGVPPAGPLTQKRGKDP